MQPAVLPILLFCCAVVALAVALLVVGNVVNPRRRGRVKQMPYESGMDPIHDTRRRFDVHFHLLAIAFLVFDAELLFLYPWAVVLGHSQSEAAAAPAIHQSTADASDRAVPAPSPASSPSAASPWAVRPVFAAGMVFLAILALGFVYDWRKGVFQWR